jgi:hypothetical protein
VTSYTIEKRRLLISQNFNGRLKDFQSLRTRESAELLDKVMVEASLTAAADKCPSVPHIPYSPALTQLQLKFTILVIQLLHGLLQTHGEMTQQQIAK